MKKRLLKIFLKLLIFLFVASLIASSVVLALLFNDARKEKNNLANKLSEVVQERDRLASTADESQTSLQKKIDDLEREVDSLKSENAKLKNTSISGFGKIKGKVTPIVIDGENFSEYQVVCAQDVEVESRLYCVGVSSLKGEYTLLIPEGQYIVFATPINANTIGSSLRVYYTEYVACLRSEESKCQDNDEIKIVNVLEGKVVEGVDPLDIVE
jgi:hypothetical protein